MKTTYKTNREGNKQVWRSAAIAVALAASFGLAGVVLTAATAGRAATLQAALSNAKVRVAETESGNVVADAIRAAAQADIAFVPAAAFKAAASVSAPANGEAAAGLVEPASDAVVVMEVRGDRILAALERSVSFAPQPSGGFLQVSGVKFSFDPKKSGQRVSGVTVNGAALEAAKVYKVAMPRPLAFGQQGYSQVWDRAAKPTDTGKSLSVALAELAQSRGSLSGSIEGRIVEVK